MKLLLGMHEINDGRITIDGYDIRRINVVHLRDEVNYINQRTTLFNDTVLNNIKYGNKKSDQEVIDVINQYKLMSIYQNLPDGLYTIAGVNGTNLSLGMQKVTMLLRGLLKQGKIVILDEPLAGLDAETRKRVLEMIQSLCKNKTLIVITHDPEIIPYMDNVYDMNEINESQSKYNNES